MNFRDYKYPIAMVFLGGMGTNNLRITLEEEAPENFKDLFLCSANTDLNVQKLHLGDENSELLAKWDSQKLLVHDLGGEETKGQGAGASRDVGRNAAESTHSQDFFRNLFEKVEEVILVSGAVGGTGGGALPVIAKLAKEMRKTTIAIVAMPQIEERRNKRAIRVLQEVRSLGVPTLAINNSHIKDYLKKQNKAGTQALGPKEAQKIINHNSSKRILQVYREFTQVPGDVKNSDPADWRTLVGLGDELLIGICEPESEKRESTTAQEVVNVLFNPEFQDVKIVERGEGAFLWFHGPWSEEMRISIMEIVGNSIPKIAAEEREDAFHWGMVENADDSKMWVSLVVIAKAPEVSDSTATEAPSAIETETVEPKSEPTPSRPRAARVLVNFHDEKGSPRSMGVDPDLANRYERIYHDPHISRERVDAVREEMRKATSFMPELPERFLEKDRAAGQ